MITVERLKELLDYHPETGEFTTKTQRRGRTQLGAIAGTTSGEGYRRIMLEGETYMGHRLAWLYVYGEWPSGILDHINRQRDDNRISNLRPATQSQNKANRLAQRNSISGIKGVKKRYRRWSAVICVRGQKFSLGAFATAEEAAAAYDVAARMHYGEFAV